VTEALRIHNVAGQRFRVVPVDLPTTPIRYHQIGRPTSALDFDRDRELACRDLREELLRLEDPETHKALVRDVLICREVFDGPHAGDFADLVVTWQQEAPITVGRSPHLGTL